MFFWVQRRTLLQATVEQRAALRPARPASRTRSPHPARSPSRSNAAALRAMESILGRGATAATPEAAERVRHAARIVQYARAAAMSSRVVVLTEALARKFYLAGDAGDIRCWRKAFGLGPGTGALAQLLAATYRDDTHRRYSNQSRDPFRAMLLAEETAVEALRHAYTSSAATAWKAAEKIGEAWDSATRTDVLLRHRHLLDGTVVRAQPAAAGPRPGGRGAVAAGADQEGQGRGDARRRPHPGPRLRRPHRAQHDRRRPHRQLHRAEAARSGRSRCSGPQPPRAPACWSPGTVPGQHTPGVRRALGDPVHPAARRTGRFRCAARSRWTWCSPEATDPAETAAPLLIKSTSCSTSPPTGVRILTIFGAQLGFSILINRGIAFLGAVQIDEVLQFCQHSRSRSKPAPDAPPMRSD